MNRFTEYCESKILELSEETENLEKNYRQDDAVFVKIKINVYDVCKTVFGVFQKTKPQEKFAAEYLGKLDEFRMLWFASKEKAEQFGDSKKVAVEEAKLGVLAEIREKFVTLWGE